MGFVNQHNLSNLSDGDLVRLEARLRSEFQHRGLTRTSSDLMGEIAEYAAHRVYGGQLLSPGNPSVDIKDSDGHRIQVKSRTLDPTVERHFSFGSWDFDVAVCLRFDRATNKLQWARKYELDELKGLWSKHPRGYRLTTGRAKQHGRDVTAKFEAVLAQMDSTTSPHLTPSPVLA